MSNAKRKPIIEPGSVLQNIIQRDRELSGRAEPAFPDSAAQEAHTDKEEEKQVSKPVSKLTSKLSPDGQRLNSKRDLRRLAADLSQSPLTTVSLKVPAGLNEWLDEYAFQHRKEGVKKQDLVRQALQLLIVELGGEEEAESPSL